MKLIETKLEGVCILQMDVFKDDRGYFFETYSDQKFNDAYRKIRGDKYENVTFVQDNESCSQRNTLRGIHWQMGEYAQAKLVRCTHGRLLDVAVDLRQDSPTYLQHIMVELSADNKMQLFIPRGFGHAFLALEDNTVLQYKCDNYYSKEHDANASAFDTKIGIEWPIVLAEAVMSKKDYDALPVKFISSKKLEFK